ncbi:unnamed protein product [Phytomonas sp. Hart1]|nr:unnamed protein product [Phytomonas sp. Hart1]|eukprot:CCW72253.1 unnamed protein product [Phytomonas sp. isolate Hart1]
MCEKCNLNYGRLDKPTCAACPTGCLNCTNNISRCDKCADGYNLNNEGDVCEIICHDDNCLKCKDGQMCETCKPGYGLNPEGKCGLCSVTNCAECNDDVTKCTICDDALEPSTQKDACVKFDGVSRVSGPLFIGLISVLGTAVLL